MDGAIATDQEEPGLRTGARQRVCQSVTDSRQHIDDQAAVLRSAIRVLVHRELDRDIARVLEAIAIRDPRVDPLEKATCTKVGWRGCHPSHGPFTPGQPAAEGERDASGDDRCGRRRCSNHPSTIDPGSLE